MPTNDQAQARVLMSSASLAVWGQIVKTLATNIDHLRPPATLQSAALPGMAGGPAPSAATHPKLAQAAAAMAATEPGETLEIDATDFQALLTECGAGITLPNGISKVRLVQSGGSMLVVRLPARQPLLTRENEILNGIAYSPMNYITDWYRGLAAFAVPTAADALAVHDQFVGDYAITHCM